MFDAVMSPDWLAALGMWSLTVALVATWWRR